MSDLQLTVGDLRRMIVDLPDYPVVQHWVNCNNSEFGGTDFGTAVEVFRNHDCSLIVHGARVHCDDWDVVKRGEPLRVRDIRNAIREMEDKVRVFQRWVGVRKPLPTCRKPSESAFNVSGKSCLILYALADGSLWP